MSDRIEEIQKLVNKWVTADIDGLDEVKAACAIADQAPYLLRCLAAAKRYIEADRAFDAAVLDKDSLRARADREAALEDWEAAKGAP